MEDKMKRKFTFLMVLVMLLVFFACDSGNGGGNAVPSGSEPGSGTGAGGSRVEIGDIAYGDGSTSASFDNTKQPVGIVIEVSDGSATKILSLRSERKAWSDEKIETLARSVSDGSKNQETIQDMENWEDLYPAFKWCDDYVDSSGNSDWYLPSKEELSMVIQAWRHILSVLEELGTNADASGFDAFWSSTEEDSDNAIIVSYSSTTGAPSSKYTSWNIRAVRKF